jgi:alkylmercury lyase
MKEEKVSNENLHALAKRFAEMFDDDKRVQRLSAEIYRQLADGQPVTAAALAGSLDSTIEDVRTAWGKLPSFYIGFDDEGRVIEWLGFGLDGGNNRFRIRGHAMHAWCAWDALFLPQIIGDDAQVEANDPETGAPISLTVSPKGVRIARPAGTVMTFAIAGMEAFPEFENFSFQKTVFFFISEDSAAAWVEKNPGPVIISLEEGFAIGKTAIRAIHPDLLDIAG